jgi:hypothetical protein
MFESSFERQPVVAVEITKVGLGAPGKPERKGVKMEQVSETAAFLESALENSESVLIPLMAAAEDHGEWDDLAVEMAGEGGPGLTGAQLRAAMKGSEIMKKASELFQKQETASSKEKKENWEEDVDLSDLDKAA